MFLATDINLQYLQFFAFKRKINVHKNRNRLLSILVKFSLNCQSEAANQKLTSVSDVYKPNVETGKLQVHAAF